MADHRLRDWRRFHRVPHRLDRDAGGAISATGSGAGRRPAGHKPVDTAAVRSWQFVSYNFDMEKTTSGDAEICYDVAGSGSPVVLLHPFPVHHEFCLPV